MKNVLKFCFTIVFVMSISLTSISCTSTEVISSEKDANEQSQQITPNELDNYSIGKDEVEDPDDRGN